MSIDEQAEASTDSSAVTVLIEHGPLYLVRSVPADTPVLAGPGQLPVAAAGDVIEGADELEVVVSFWVDIRASVGEAAEPGGGTRSWAEPDVRRAIAMVVAMTANTRTATIADAAGETWKRAGAGLDRYERMRLLT
jgi:hypothetical protein